ncbi:HAD family hydrolase [Ramlibacter rhizophilus]|uniref:HAD family hydrolase n=1 Tax=Ramlibacter rhizophilus TaxID=1781167 RepID=A0A4Z0BF57_9BURK|nr:HAD family hydrolase [Ramlibacter rhizophilus]TFY96947.1 HAD family hydrolase [Ramlibacter rhizophilus]
MTPVRLALFDLDHTLLPIDSDHAWGVFTQDIGWCDPSQFKARNDDFFAQYQAGTLDVHEYVRFATEALCRRSPEEAAQAHARFMREVITPVLLPAARALVEQHRAAGDRLLIITATNEFVTRPIADALGIEELIAVRLARGADGWITGEIDGVPSMREGKVHRFEEWLAANGLDWSRVDTTFYSDSMNDLPLLERVRHPVATNPDARLRRIARERGWRILDLFEPNP